MSVLLTLCTVLLVLVSLFLILLVLMQRANSNAGIGSALAGGFSESTFGAESTSVLSRWTVYAAVIFFLLSFALYLGNMAMTRRTHDLDKALPTIEPIKSIETHGEVKAKFDSEITSEPATSETEDAVEPTERNDPQS